MPFERVRTGGVAVAGADVDRDGRPDLIAAAVTDTGPRVRVFSGATGAMLHDLRPFSAGAWGGARAGLAYVTDDARADVVVGRGEGVLAF